MTTAQDKQNRAAPPWWRKRADEIELAVAAGKMSATACYTQMQQLLDAERRAHDTLAKIAEVAACFGADWPDVEGEPEVLRRVKWAARQLKAAQEHPLLTDERISEIDDETHFHESPDWPRRFARGIEAETRKKPTP